MNFSNLLMFGIEDANMQKNKKSDLFLSWKGDIFGAKGLSFQI